MKRTESPPMTKVTQHQLDRLEAKLKEQLGEAYRSGAGGRNNSAADTANYLTGYIIGLLSLELDAEPAKSAEPEASLRVTSVSPTNIISFIDEIIDIEAKAFSKWTQTDIANFFNEVGKIRRELIILEEKQQ